MRSLKKNLINFLMKNYHLILMAVILVGGITVSALAEEARVENIVSIENNGSAGYTITIQTPSLEISSVRIKDQEFVELEAQTDGLTGEPGLPALPTFSRWIEVPAGTTPSISFFTGSESYISDINIAPFPHVNDDNPNIAEPAPQTIAYTARDFYYPTETASVSEPILVGTKYMALVDIFPYQYNAAQKQLRIYEDIEISVSFEASPKFNNDMSRRSAPVYRELDRALNGGSPIRDDFASRQDNLGHYVFVARDERVIEILEPLLEWKRKKGFIVTIAHMEDIGNGRGDINEYLQNAWDEWDIPPNFVILAGDQDGDLIVPCYRAQPNISWNASDNQYVDWDSEGAYGEWIPEGFIGRLPAALDRHLEAMVAKIVGYESDPFIEEPWVEGGTMIANGVQSCIACNIAVREMMVNYGYSRNRITEAYADYHQGERPNINSIIDGINEGVGFINFRGYNNWGDFLTNHINQLTNGWMLPVVGGMVCGTNDFTNTFNDQRPECRAETFLRAWSGDTPKGGIACYGPTDLYTHTWFNNIVDAEFFNVLYNKDVRTLGVMCAAAKMALLRNLPSYRTLGDGHTVGYYFYTYNLMGDPGMQVWTRDPKSVEIEFEAEVPFGSTIIQAVISAVEENQELPPIYVHIYADGEDGEIRYGGYTDENGEISLNVESLPIDEYSLTITGDNIVPILESFTVVRPSVFASITEVTYSDDNEGESNGNDDGDLNPGETVEVSILLTNTGTQDSEEISGVLSTTSPYIELERDEANWNAMVAGESTTNEQAFIINVAIGTPKFEKIEFILTTVHGETEMDGGFVQTVYGYNFTLAQHVFIGEDVELEPDSEEQLLITLVNDGTFDSNDLNSALFCNDPKIQIRRSEAFLGDLPIDEDVTNVQSPFIIYAAEDMYTNRAIAFGLLISDEDGRKDSLEFDIIMVGSPETAPQGPTEYGYWAFDSRDTTGNMDPTYDWVEGQNDLNLHDVNDAPTPSGAGGSNRVIELPFEFTYFSTQYSNITVGSNGWLCFGRTEHVGWNNQEIGSGLAPPSMLAPYWTDLWNGDVLTVYDAETSRFIIEWRDFSGGGSPPTFAVHLYERDARPTITGDCEFEFVYKAERGRQGPGRDLEQEDVTIGFGSPDRKDEMTLTHADVWDPRAEGMLDELDDGMSVRFTTGLIQEIGGVRGNVTAVEDGEPMEDVRVMLDGTGFFDKTDANGNYFIEIAPVGTYSVIAQKRYFNNDVEVDIQILEDEVTQKDFQMTYPTFSIDREDIIISVLPGQSDSTVFNVLNEGNGPLDYSFNINYEVEQPERRDGAWDMLFDFAVGDSVDDSRIYGVAFLNDTFYITGQLIRRQFPHKIYKIDKDGNYVGNFDQHTVDSTSATGYLGIEPKGENLLAVEGNVFIELTTEGVGIDTIPAPFNRTQCLAWSPERGTIFSKTTTGRAIIESDLDGNEINVYQVVGDNIRTYGMTWFPEDEDGYNLYLFGSYENPIDSTNLLLFKMSPETGDIRLVKALKFDGLNMVANKPQGCTITKAYNPLIWTFAAVIKGSPNDYLKGWELGPNLTWISYEPKSGQIPAGDTQPFKLNFYTEGMPEREYHVILELYHNAVGNMQEIPIFFNVGENSVPDGSDIIASDFRIDGAYPNPFNPTTTISYNLPEASEVSIGIYSVDGRMIDLFEQSRQGIGSQNFLFDASGYSSGIYFVKVTAGVQSATRKLVLMR